MSHTGVRTHIENISKFRELSFRQKLGYLMVGVFTVVVPSTYYTMKLVAPLVPNEEEAMVKGDLTQ